MRVTTSKSKNAESFYITKSFIDDNGKSTSRIIRKLGTLAELSAQLHTDRAGVMAWAKEQARLETEKYNSDKEESTVLIPFHANQPLDYGKQVLYSGGYLFLQSVYYQLKLDQVCRKIKSRHDYQYDLNAILSDLVYTRILSPKSKASSYKEAQKYLESPSYECHDIYRSLSILAEECDFIQAEAYHNSSFFGKRNDRTLYYDCTNYYFEIEQEEGIKKYGKSKEHRPNPIVQMGLFMDGDGIPLAFSLFPGNQNEQKSLKPLERTVINDFGCSRFIFCSDSGLGSEDNRLLNHLGDRAFVITQSLKKLGAEEQKCALDPSRFRRLSNNQPVNISELTEEDSDGLFYHEEPYSGKKLEQRMIITYSPKYAAYQRQIRKQQVERAMKMVQEGKSRKQRKNPHDPGRFVGKIAVTNDGEKAHLEYYLDEEKIAEEARFDGFYAICTDLWDDDPKEIIRISERRWQIEECFRIMKTEFSARPVYVQREDRIKAHFLICFLALLVYRLLEKKLDEKNPGKKYTCSEILSTLKEMNFASVEEQGFMPLYERTELTDALHEICGFRTDYQFISKSKMREIEKNSKGRK